MEIIENKSNLAVHVKWRECYILLLSMEQCKWWGVLLPFTSYSAPYNISLGYEDGLPLSGSFGKQR
jgi:hypothetical protein